MRLLAVALLLCLSMPAWAAGVSLSAQDEARLIYLEKRVGELDAQNRELRTFAKETAKGEADGVKDIAAAQVQGLNSTLANWLTAVGVITALLAAVGFFNMAKIKAEALGLAREESQKEANAYLDRLNSGLTTKVKELEQRLADQEAKAMAEMQERLRLGLNDIDSHVARARKGAAEVEEASRMLQARLSGGSSEGENPVSTTPTPEIPSEEMSLPRLVNAAWADFNAGRIAEAIAKALILAEHMPKVPSVHILLSRCHLAEGRLDEAADAARCAIKVAKGSVFQELEGTARCDLGDALLLAGKLEEARAAFTQYHDFFADLVAKRPDKDEWQRALGVAWSRLGGILLKEGKAEDARNAFARDRDISTTLSEKLPENADWRRALGAAQRNMARVLIAVGEEKEAEAALDQSESIAQSLLSSRPDLPLYRRDLGCLNGVWGDWHLARGEGEEARRQWDLAVRELGALEAARQLDSIGQMALKEYRNKLAG